VLKFPDGFDLEVTVTFKALDDTQVGVLHPGDLLAPVVSWVINIFRVVNRLGEAQG
jgi:hypothetical protein